jgi:hypothetical protein
MKENYAAESKDLSFVDLNPGGLAKLNELIRAESCTYYFSISNGFRNKKSTPQREVFKLPKQISKLAVGFDLNIDQEVVFSSNKLKTKEKQYKSYWSRLLFNIRVFTKYLINPVFAHFTFFQET